MKRLFLITLIIFGLGLTSSCKSDDNFNKITKLDPDKEYDLTVVFQGNEMSKFDYINITLKDETVTTFDLEDEIYWEKTFRVVGGLQAELFVKELSIGTVEAFVKLNDEILFSSYSKGEGESVLINFLQ